MIFKRMIVAFDRLAPAIDRQTEMIKEQTKNEEALRRQTQLLQEEVEKLREAMSAHDATSSEIADNTRKTMERLEIVSAQLERCMLKLEERNNGTN